jgi:hypothetical protein
LTGEKADSEQAEDAREVEFVHERLRLVIR